MSRAFTFGAGPAALPDAVLARARDELLEWGASRLSVWELPFTGEDFRAIQAHAEASLRRLLDIPHNYHVLFLQGGASAQFALLPLNLALIGARAAYVETGHWSNRALREAARYGQVDVVASGAPQAFARIPPASAWRLEPDAAYCHICANETANGVEFHSTPPTGVVPLVADMSSNLLSRPIDVSEYGLIYASAQKNIGPAGLTLMIVRDMLLARGARPETPSVFNYRAQAEAGSCLNTPPTYAIYLAGLVLDWLLTEGGLLAMQERNRRKSEMVYRAIDESDGFYRCRVNAADRSRMNICFELPCTELDERFIAEADAAGLKNLRGHSALGGARASLYNALPETAAAQLADFMEDFARRWRGKI